MHIGKEEIKMPLWADKMIIYIENPKKSTKELLELINKSNKVAVYKINTQNLYFLSKDNEQMDEINNTIYNCIEFIIAQRI